MLGELDAALDQLPVEQQNELMTTLAGSYGITAFRALRAADGIGAMEESMLNQNAASTVANTMMGTFENTVGSLMGSIESLQIAALTPLIQDSLQPLANQLIAVVNNITAWVNENPDLTRQIVMVVGALVTLGPVLFGIGKGISIFGSLLTSLMNPIGLIIAAVTALSLAYATNFMGFADFIQPAIDAVSSAFSMFQYLLAQGQAPLDAFVGALRISFGDGVANAIGGFITFVSTAFNTIVSIVAPIVSAVVTVFGTFFGAISSGTPFFSALYFSLLQVFSAETAQQILGFVGQFVNFMNSIWTTITTIIIPVLGLLFNWFVTEALPAIVNFVQTIVIPAITGFIGILGQIWTDVAPFLISLFNWFITEGLPLIVSFVTDIVVPAVQGFIDILIDTWEAVSPFLQSLYDWFITNGLPAITNILDGATTIVQGFIDLLAGIWSVVSVPLGLLYDWFVNSLGWVLDNIIRPMITAVGDVVTGIGDLSGSVGNIVGGAASGVGNFLSGIGNTVSSMFGGTDVNFASRDGGGEGIAGMAYNIGRSQVGNEAFIPGDNGTFYPDLRESITALVSGSLQGGGTAGQQFAEGAIIIYANNPQEAADTFAQRLNDLQRSRGGG